MMKKLSGAHGPGFLLMPPVAAPLLKTGDRLLPHLNHGLK